jgi:hypothetical protein
MKVLIGFKAKYNTKLWKVPQNLANFPHLFLVQILNKIVHASN